MRTDVEKISLANYYFILERKTAVAAYGNYLTVWVVQDTQMFLRDFYFDEADAISIRAFCCRFALDAAYRQQVLTGDTRWARRNALFMRNLPSILGNDLSNPYQRACAFFHWLDLHLEIILALPSYQHPHTLDNAFQSAPDLLDPFIQPAIYALKRVSGLTIHSSCQGISAKVRFQDYDLLAVSPHDEFAFVSFSLLEPPTHAAISALLPLFPSITDAPLPHRSHNLPILRSTGNNLRFRAELLELARNLLP